MTIPAFETLMLPMLELMSDLQPRRNRELSVALSNKFHLSDVERAETLPSGPRVIDSRVAWAVTHMYQAGLLARPARGVIQITDEGTSVVAEAPGRVNMKYLQRYPSYVEFRSRRNKVAKSAVPAESSGVNDDAGTLDSPQDLMDAAVAENRAAVQGDVLARAMSLDPTSFERLVVRLLSAMGYGASGQIEHSGKSGDGGFDGINSQDPLGLDRVYMQAKRYAVDNVVNRPVVQGFVGALFGAQGDRGVFITTSRFSPGAREEADRVNARIELIDGERLSELLVRHGVGVQVESTAVLHRLDEDFFEAL